MQWPMDSPMTDSIPERHRYPRLRLFLGMSAVIFGLGLVVLVSAVGHCSAFGGACPSDPPALWDDDVFGSAAAGGFIAVAIPMWLREPTWLRLRTAMPVGLAVAVVVGLIARSAAAG